MEETTQSPMPTEDLRAALGYANNILSQTIPPDEEAMMNGEQPTDTPPEATEAPQSEVPMKNEEMPMEAKKAQDEAIKEEVKRQVEEALAPIKDALQSALDEDEEETD